MGVLLWGGGELYYSAVLWTADPMPFPSLADALWLAFYVPTFAGIVLLARERAGPGVQIAEETYQIGTILDAGWLLAAVVITLGAFLPGGRRAGHVRGWASFVFPAFFGFVGLAILVYDHLRPVHLLALALSTGSVLAVIVRMTLIFRENLAMLRASRLEATRTR